MITKFKIFEFEQYDDFDPYGEEDWLENFEWINVPEDYLLKKGDKVKIRPDSPFRVEKGINGGLYRYEGTILNDRKRKPTIAFCWDVKFENGQTRNFRTIDLMMKKIKIFEQDYYDIDPYGEENWVPGEIVVDIITPKISEDRQNSFWYYGDTIARVSNGEHTIDIYASGDIAVYFEENGSKYKNMNAIQYAINNNLTDKDLRKISDWDGWINNNWFEMEVDGRDTGFIDVIADEYDEAVECAKGIIKEL